MKVLATGATGQYAHHVVAALVAKGIDVRGVVNDPAKATPTEPEGLAQMFADYDRHGFHDGNSLVLQTIL